jgi:SpoVK/Ycf46/Vps4 family AAA+-type ATPase
VAQRIGWLYIELSPTDFLRGGLPSIYGEAKEIFDDLKDLREVVILFDEMDALARTREDERGDHPLDVTQQLLTTSMLPKLAALHDQPDAVFFMATNFQSRFDDAIKRPGRFDLLLHLGPPSWDRKVNGIAQFWMSADGRKATNAEILHLQETLRAWAPVGDELAKKLDYFTFGEMRSFFDSAMIDAGGPENLLLALEQRGQDSFMEKATRWHEEYITLRPRPPARPKAPEDELTRYHEDEKASRRQ